MGRLLSIKKAYNIGSNGLPVWLYTPVIAVLEQLHKVMSDENIA
jgi:hypothetical protein